jgi:hypothetical protein
MLSRIPVLTLTLAVLPLSFALGCDAYDAPPQPSLPDVDEFGVLADAAAPLKLAFHEPVDPATFNVRVIRYQVDGEGRLYDEDDNPSTELDVIYEWLHSSEEGGLGEFNAAKTVYSMGLNKTLPIGPQLAVVIEPGLADQEGHAWDVRQILKFGVNFDCGAEPKPTTFADTRLFTQVEVDSPLDTQIQLFVHLRVDPDTGIFVGQFTNADRDGAIDCAPLGLNCNAETEVCRTLPEPACVEPSRRIATVEEYPDYIHNAEGQTGYSFTARGCIEDRGENTWAFTNAPADVQVPSPPVGIKGIKLNIQFEFDQQGVLRGSGAFSAQELFLGATPNGVALGSVFLRDIPADEVKDGFPAPPYGPGDIPPG